MDYADLVLCTAQLAVLGALLLWCRRLAAGTKSWLFQLLLGAFGCNFSCTLFWVLHILIVGHWPDTFSPADFSLLGVYAFLLAAVLGLSGEWDGVQRVAARRFRLPALLAPAVVIGFHIAYVHLYVIGYDNNIADWLNNVCYCTMMSLYGYYAFRAWLVSRAASGPFRRFYAALLLFLLHNLLIFLVSSMGWDGAYIAIGYLEMPVTGYVVYTAKKGAVAA